MLQHQTQEIQDETPLSARQRVTPEELAQALAAIEARKEQSEREATGMVAIGEAVQQLGFDATADEVWAQVQAQRQQKEHPAATRLPRKTRRRLILGACVGAAAVFGSLFLHMVREPTVDVSPSPPALHAVIPPSPFTASPFTDIETLAQIPNNSSFYCGQATARVILSHTPSEASGVSVTSGSPRDRTDYEDFWTFTKHDGKIYIHGYTAKRSARAMQTAPISVSNIALDDTNPGGTDNSQPITLQIGTFHIDNFYDYGDGANGASGIVVSAIHPDKHFGDSP